MAEQSFVAADHRGIVAGSEPDVDEAIVAETEPKALSAMTRAELEAYAIERGIERPENKDTFPNVDALRDAIAAAEDAG